MIPLLNGCYRSDFAVTPKNWNSPRADMKRPWRIHYRFYDPRFKKAKQIPVKGMNHITSLKLRQAATRELLAIEEQKIDNEGWNPITGENMFIETGGEVSPDTRLFHALEIARGMLQVVPDMMSDIKSILKYLKQAGGKLEDKVLCKKYTDLKIGQVKRRHLVYLLDQCRKDNKRFTNYRRNKYRTALIMLFKKLLELEAVEDNPAMLIAIEKHTYKKRKLLTAAEWLIIDTNLKALDYYFWRYFRIFFRSGSRSSELFALKNGRNIDLEKQEYTIIVKKGRDYRESVRPIPVDVLDLWAEVVNETPAGEYIFGAGFKPGKTMLRKECPNRKWRKLVKKKMEIDKDFYSLKHLNQDLIDQQLGIKHAAAAAGIDEATAIKHYAVGHKQRELDKLKTIRVDF